MSFQQNRSYEELRNRPLLIRILSTQTIEADNRKKRLVAHGGKILDHACHLTLIIALLKVLHNGLKQFQPRQNVRITCKTGIDCLMPKKTCQKVNIQHETPKQVFKLILTCPFTF